MGDGTTGLRDYGTEHDGIMDCFLCDRSAGWCRRPRFLQRERSGAGRLTRETSHDVPNNIRGEKAISALFSGDSFLVATKGSVTGSWAESFSSFFARARELKGETLKR